MAFTYAAREEGKKEKEYGNKVNTLATKGYDDSNKQGMEQYRTAYENFKPFEYDVNGDALYQQYKDQYTRQGNLAMQDTIGKASAMTGGYGNSYAQQVGQQTFNGYMQALNDKIPELYALAYDKYNQEKADVYNMYQMYADADATNYNRWANDIGIYAGLHDSERAYNTDVYNAKRNLAYNEYADEQANNATIAAAQINASKPREMSTTEANEMADWLQSKVSEGWTGTQITNYLDALVWQGTLTDEAAYWLKSSILFPLPRAEDAGMMGRLAEIGI